MKRFFSLFVIFIAMSAVAYSISFNRIIYPVKIKDASGYMLVQQRPPQTIVSASPVITEILLALNLEDKIIGISDDSKLTDKSKKAEKIGKGKIDGAKLLKLKPDLVIAPLDIAKSDLESLRKVHFLTTVTFETWTGAISTEVRDVSLEVFTVDPKSLQDVYATIGTIGTITNKEHAAYSLLQRMKRRIDWVTSRGLKEKRMKAMVISSKRPVTVVDTGILADLAKAAGFSLIHPRSGENRMKRDEITKADPDIIVSSTDVARNPKDIYNNRDFRKTGAGKNKRAVCVDKELLKPGPRLADALDEIAIQAYGWPRENDRGEGSESEQNKE